MLRLFDAATRQVEGIRPGHRGELRVLAVTPDVPGEPGPGLLREWLLPDLIRRCAERRSLVPTICEITGPAGIAASPGHGASQAGAASPGQAVSPEDAAAADHAAARGALNIHPPARIAPAFEPVETTIEFVAPGQASGTTGSPLPFDLGTGETGWLAGREVVRYRAAPTGAVRVSEAHEHAGGRGPLALPAVAARGIDPLAVRLVFLGHGYTDDLDLTWDVLHAADKTLSHWRESVAEWALSPSAAMSRRYADAIAAAFEDDLDTPGALRELHDLEADGDVTAGAKFETFAAADRLFGLDLARDIGKV